MVEVFGKFLFLSPVLGAGEVTKKFLSFKVGDGTRIFMWQDCWHPDGYLLN
jgi:hypothetical protein